MKQRANTYKFLTLNVAGLKHLIERKRLAKFLKVSVVCLQETHLKQTEQKYLSQVFRDKNYHSFSMVRVQGVMTGIAAGFPWVLSHLAIDTAGRYVILKGKVYSRQIVIAALYAPNIQQVRFWHEFFECLTQFMDNDLVIMGDFNAVFENKMDCTRDSSTLGFPKVFYDYMERF